MNATPAGSRVTSTPDGRVRYRERQPLCAGDLTTEQAYRLAMRRRHDRGAHSWGIVTGLQLDDQQGHERIVVEPFTRLAGLLPRLDQWLCDAVLPVRPPAADDGGDRDE